MAEKYGLPAATRKDSLDLCFLAGEDYRNFLQRNAAEMLQPGEILTRDGRAVGEHNGLANYTIGQRKGLDITFGRPVYVTNIIPETNTVMLGEEDDLNRQDMLVSKINWIKYEGITDGTEALTKIRYKDKGALSTLYTHENGVRVEFSHFAKGIAPGQSAVFYEGDDVIGGGVIQRGQLA
jgi:tRNA-specific 2-thiouridylase